MTPTPAPVAWLTAREYLDRERARDRERRRAEGVACVGEEGSS